MEVEPFELFEQFFKYWANVATVASNVFMIKITITGILVGIIGYFIGEKLQRRFANASFKEQLAWTVVGSVLICTAAASPVATFFGDLVGITSGLALLALVPGMSIVIIFCWLVGYKSIFSFKSEMATPLAAGLAGFIIGLIHHEPSIPWIGSGDGTIAVIKLFFGTIGGAVSSLLAYITGKTLRIVTAIARY
jgi:hypothetical protein